MRFKEPKDVGGGAIVDAEPFAVADSDAELEDDDEEPKNGGGGVGNVTIDPGGGVEGEVSIIRGGLLFVGGSTSWRLPTSFVVVEDEDEEDERALSFFIVDVGEGVPRSHGKESSRSWRKKARSTGL